MESKEVINVIGDSRVSTPKQMDGRGLEDQELIVLTFIKARGWNLVEMLSNEHSGRKEERADFEDAIERIKKSKKRGVKIHYYVVKSIDRFTRRGSLTYGEMKNRLGALGVKLIDVYGIIQEDKNTLEHLDEEYDWSVYSPSETAELVEATRGKAEVRDILTRMIGAEISLVKEGYSMRAPNDGYANAKDVIDGTELSVLVQDEERAHFYKTMFEMRASGRFSDEEIVEKLNALGYRSKSRKKWKKVGKKRVIIGKTKPLKLTVKKLQKIMLRTMYAGVKYEKWNKEPVYAVFLGDSRPIVTVKVFNAANRGKVYIRNGENGQPEVLYNFNEKERSIKTRRKYHPDYTFDKMVGCSCCRSPFKNSGIGNPGKSGKRYKGYHCDRTLDGQRHYLRIPKDELEENVIHLLSHLKFKDNFMARLEKKLIKKYREREQDILSSSIKIGANVNELKLKQEQLLNSIQFTESQLVRKQLEMQYEELQKEIDKATEERDKIEIQERDIKSFVKYAKDLMEHPAKMLADNSNPYKQLALFGLVFEQLPTYKEIVNGTPKLTLLFKLSEDFKVNEVPVVSL